jgi:uncharacterized protein YndB with AHSA1/START domain
VIGFNSTRTQQRKQLRTPDKAAFRAWTCDQRPQDGHRIDRAGGGHWLGERHHAHRRRHQGKVLPRQPPRAIVFDNDKAKQEAVIGPALASSAGGQRELGGSSTATIIPSLHGTGTETNAPRLPASSRAPSE